MRYHSVLLPHDWLVQSWIPQTSSQPTNPFFSSIHFVPILLPFVTCHLLYHLLPSLSLFYYSLFFLEPIYPLILFTIIIPTCCHSAAPLGLQVWWRQRHTF